MSEGSSITLWSPTKSWPKNYRPRKKTVFTSNSGANNQELLMKGLLLFPHKCCSNITGFQAGLTFFSLVDTFRQIRFTEADKVSFVNI